MTVALTYDSVLSRVRIAASSLVTGVDHITVERSTDQIRWTTVRGGSAVPVLSSAASLDDYEFAPDVENFYRVSAVDTGAITFVGAGTNGTAVNTSTTPALPSFVAGDLGLIQASIRNSGTGTVDTPTGWTPLVTSGNVTWLGRRLEVGDVAPTITFTGGVANADVIAQPVVFRNAELVPANTAVQLNASAQNIAYPALTVPDDGHAVVLGGWKQDDASAAGTPAGFAGINTQSVTAGDDAAQTWRYQIQTTGTNIGSGTLTMTGGAAAISRALLAAFAPAAYRTRETESITPTIDQVWIKSISRPFLNRAVDIRDQSEISRPSRSGVFEVVGRSFPVAVNDVRGSKRWTLELRAETVEEAEDLDLVLSSGDPLFIQVPTTGPLSVVQDGYVTVGTTTMSWLTPFDPIRILTLPCTAIAAPGPDVVGATYTWQGVLNDYGSWADLLAANATWADLLENVGDSSDVVVP